MIDRDILLRALGVKASRHAELARMLEDPAIVVDHNKVRVISREMGSLREFARIHGEIVAAKKAVADANEMISAGSRDHREAIRAMLEKRDPKFTGN